MPHMRAHMHAWVHRSNELGLAPARQAKKPCARASDITSSPVKEDASMAGARQAARSRPNVRAENAFMLTCVPFRQREARACLLPR